LSDQTINTNITATANFGALTAQLDAVTASLTKLQETTIGLNKNLSNQVSVMNRSFAETMRSTGQFSTHFVTLQGDVNKFGKALDKGQLSLSQYYQTWQGHAKKTSTLISDLANQQVRMQQAVLQPLGKNAQGLMQYNVMVAQGLDTVKNKAALATQEARIMNKVMQDGANQLINWGKNTQWAGRQLTVGLTVPLAAFGVAASKAFLAADQELVRLTKVYGGLAATSASELLKVRQDVSATAKEMASSYGVAYTDTIALAADMAATGKTGNDLLKSTVQTTRLAVLGEVSRQDAMKATLAIQNTFKQNTEQLTQSIDFLNAVENQTSTSLNDLVTAIPKAGPVIQAMGGNVKDLALMLVAMKEGGIDATQGANALKSALASLINPTSKAVGMFKGFGIDLKGLVTANAGNLTGTIVELQKALDKLNPLQKQQAIEQLFGKFQFARMNALFANLGKQGSQTLQVLDLMKASTTDLANVSARELSQVTESASGKYKRALASVQADMAQIGNSFLKINTFVLKTIDGIVKFFDKLPGPVKSVLTLLGGFTAIAGPLIMLTGVLGNFFGYVVKGVFHLKNLFKGGQGFKLLTPELMAAAKAGSLVETSFYSDAKATTTFAEAVYSLSAAFEKLQQKALESTQVVSNSITTMAGTPVISSNSDITAARMANKDHPLIGNAYSRDMIHLNPTGSKTAEQNAAQTIFSTNPGPKPVNQRIGNNPQILMMGNNPLPSVPGITSIRGVSTGIVAEEAAKWHAMTAAIATQSEAEIAALKTEINATGIITNELAGAYEAMLPEMMKLTTLAAKESGAIVAELEAGKVTVTQARAQIMALNAQVETMMAETATQVATGMARTINLTTVPLTSQPVVGANGKSNMKELFHKSTTSNLVDKIAGSLGVKTSGGGYSIETTKPIKLNTGGKVYNPNKDGAVVPGDKSVNYDNTPAQLEEGGFILNKQASQNNPQLVGLAKNQYNGGGKVDALLTPGETYFNPQTASQMMPTLEKANSGSRIQLHAVGGQVTNRKFNYGPILPRDRNLTIFLEELGLKAMGPRAAKSLSEISALNEEKKAAALQLIKEKVVPILKRAKSLEAVKPGNVLARTTGVIEEAHIREIINPLLTENGLDPLSLNQTIHNTHLTQRNGNQVSGFTALYTSTSNLRANQARLKPIDFINNDLTDLGAVNRYQRFLGVAGASGVEAKKIELAINAKIKQFFENEAHSRGIDISALPTIGDTLYPRGAASGNKVSTAGYTFQDHILPIIESTMSEFLGNGFKSYPAYQTLKANNITRTRTQRLALGGRVKGNKHNYGIMNSNLFMAKNPNMFAFATKEQMGWRNWAKDGVGPDLHRALAKKFEAYPNGQMPTTYNPEKPSGKFPMPRSYYQDILNSDPLHGPLQIGRYQPPMHIRSQQQGARIRYTGTGYHKADAAPAFAIGDIESRAKTALFNYMQGDYAAIDDPAVQSYLSAIRTKFTGTLHRGVRNVNSLPPVIRDLIAAGRWEDLVGKEFIMRRSSWSTNKDTAEGFGQLQMVASVKNRNAVPASQIFPDLTFQSASGPVHVNESEVYMGGKFRVVAAGKNKLKLQAVVDGQREHGGPVNAGGSYLVGEKGPELFTPQSSGSITSNANMQHFAKGGKVYQVGSKGANTKVYGPGEIPEFKGNLFAPMLNSLDTAMLMATAGIKAAPSQLNAAIKAMPEKVKQSAFNAALKTDMALTKAGKTLSSGINKIKDTVSTTAAQVSSGLSSSATKLQESLQRIKQAAIRSAMPTTLPVGPMTQQQQGMGFWQTVRSNTKNNRFNIGGGKMSASSAGLGMGLMMGSGMLGGQLGMAAMGTGLALQMGALTAIEKSLLKIKSNGFAAATGMTKIASSLKGVKTAFQGVTVMEGIATVMAKGFGTAMKTAMAESPLIILLAVIAAATAAIKLFQWFRKERAQDAKQVTLTNGMTAKGAQQAGIKYHDLSSSIKDVNAQLELTRAKGKAAFQSFQNGGQVQGLTMSVGKLKAAIADAKKNQTELVGAFSDVGNGSTNNADKQQMVNDMAANLKAQFISSGMSAEDATNKIFAMIKASKNADMAFNAISAKGFTKVTDAASATTAVVENLNKKMADREFYNTQDTVGTATFKGADLGNALSNSTSAIDSQMQKLIGTKDAMGNVIDAAKAYSMTMDDINKKQGAGNKLTDDQVASLKASHPELEKILNSTDTTASTFAKWQIELSGVQTDLKNISGEEAQMIAQFEQGIKSAISAQEATGKGVLGRTATLVKTLQKNVAAGGEAASIAAQKAQINVQNEIKLIDKKIKAIQDEAQARRDAISVQKQQQDLADQIASKQLDILAAQATGNTQAEQQAKLDRNKLIREQQAAAATDAINAKEKAQVDALNKSKEKQQALADAAAKKLADAQAAAAQASTRLSTVQNFQGQYESLVQQRANAKLMTPGKERDQALKDVEGNLISLVNTISASAKGKDTGLAKMLKDTFGGSLIDAKTGAGLTGTTTAKYNGSQFESTFTAGAAEKTLAGSAADATKSAIDKMAGGRSLADVERAIQGKGVLGGKTRSSALAITEEGKYKKITSGNKKGYLDDASKDAVVLDNKLQPGQFFSYAGFDYKVGTDYKAVRIGKTVKAVENDPYHATGGLIKGPGNGTSDSIWMPGALGKAKTGAYVSNGEFVTRASSVSSIGAGAMELMNKFGVNGLIGAALGKLKFNTPTNGFQMHDTQSSSNGTINLTQNIYGTPGMDMDAFAKKVVDMSVQAIGQGAKINTKMHGVKRTVRV
jgi:hypothetical protein